MRRRKTLKSRREEELNKWFWTFKHKLVDEYPEYRIIFDTIVGRSDDNDTLYEVMELGYRYLEIERDIRRYNSIEELTVIDYVNALNEGYERWRR